MLELTLWQSLVRQVSIPNVVKSTSISLPMGSKVQSVSLGKAVIDLGNDIFDHGRLTLSRVRMLKGVLLIGLIRASFDNNKS